MQEGVPSVPHSRRLAVVRVHQQGLADPSPWLAGWRGWRSCCCSVQLRGTASADTFAWQVHYSCGLFEAHVLGGQQASGHWDLLASCRMVGA